MKYSNAFSSQIKLTIKVSAFSKKYSWGFWCISRSSLGSCIWCCCGCGRRCCYCVTGDLFLLCQKKTFIPQKIHLYFLQQILRLISCSPYAFFCKGLNSSRLFDLNFRPDPDLTKNLWNCGIRNQKSLKFSWKKMRIGGVENLSLFDSAI